MTNKKLKMTSPIANNISVGVSPILSNTQSNASNISNNSQLLSKTSNEIQATISSNIASQSAVALGSARKDGIQYPIARTEKAFESKKDKEIKEDDENQEPKDKKLDLRI